jgi:hypothetical protein
VKTETNDKQKRGAIVTGLVLAAMALGIYLVVILKFAR